MLEGTLWRLCASSRLANHRSVFHSCQQFQEKDNLFSKGVNVSSKLSTKLQKNHQNQEKTFVWSICHFVISSFRHFSTGLGDD
jgi:hypothetical protein